LGAVTGTSFPGERGGGKSPCGEERSPRGREGKKLSERNYLTEGTKESQFQRKTRDAHYQKEQRNATARKEKTEEKALGVKRRDGLRKHHRLGDYTPFYRIIKERQKNKVGFRPSSTITTLRLAETFHCAETEGGTNLKGTRQNSPQLD